MFEKTNEQINIFLERELFDNCCFSQLEHLIILQVQCSEGNETEANKMFLENDIKL